MNDIERIAEAAYASFYGDDVVEIAGARCLRAPGAPDVPMLNRVVGLGVGRDVSDEELDAIEEAMAGVSYYVAVSADASPSLDARLAERGFEEGWGWMLFERPPLPATRPETSLTVRETTEADTDDWARIVGIAYGLPVDLGRWIASTLAHPNWTGFIAFDGDEPAAAAASWLEGGAAYFGFAGTLPDKRGRGGQAALFAARIEHALAAGCTRLVTETGERRDDLPSNSYRNILRQGFEERFVTAHRVRRLAP
jgi:GNAT superfamily N-acetyltransferase